MTAAACLLAYLLLSAVVSYEDWTTRKIRNGRILLGLAICAGAAGLLALNSVLGVARLKLGPLGEHYLPLGYYSRLAVHAALSLAAGFGLWRAGIWPAGDAKFFALSSLFAGLIEPNLPGFPWASFLLLLINAFVPAGALFALETVLLLAARAARGDAAEGAKRLKAEAERLSIRVREAWPYRRQYALLALNLYALFLGVQLAAPFLASGFEEPWRSLVMFAVMFALWTPLSAVLRDARAAAAGAAALAAAAALSAVVPGWSPWAAARGALRMTLNFGMLLGAGRLALDWVIERESRRELRGEEVAEGTILSDDTWTRLSAEGPLAERLGSRLPDGLSAEEAGEVRRWALESGAPGHSVYRTIPFAFWIVLGALITLSTGRSVMTLAAPFWERLKEAF